MAAEQFSWRGMDAFALAGGMKAWSLAWNTAELVLGNTTVVQVRRTGKGCLSYLLGSRSEALVIDASLDPAVYLRLADQHRWSIRYVLDTHIHADHLSRSRALAEAARVKLLLPVQKKSDSLLPRLRTRRSSRSATLVSRRYPRLAIRWRALAMT